MKGLAYLIRGSLFHIGVKCVHLSFKRILNTEKDIDRTNNYSCQGKEHVKTTPLIIVIYGKFNFVC